MLDLSPTKLFIVFVVAVVLLGPKRLPEVARQLGAGWRKLRALHHQIDQELRQSMPGLPSSQEIARFARSPISLLNQLADRPDGPGTPEPGAARLPGNGAASPDAAAREGAVAASPLPGAADGRTAGALGGAGALAGAGALEGLDADDPTLN